MILLIMTSMLVSSIIISSNLPFNFILLLIFLAIFGSLEIAMSSSIFWLPMIVIMLFVGGLMIIYIFIMSMNSEMTMKEKYSFFLLFPIIMMLLMQMKKSNLNSKMKGSSMFSMSWWYIMFMMTIIILSMLFMSKIIINPLKPSKKMK